MCQDKKYVGRAEREVNNESSTIYFIEERGCPLGLVSGANLRLFNKSWFWIGTIMTVVMRQRGQHNAIELPCLLTIRERVCQLISRLLPYSARHRLKHPLDCTRQAVEEDTWLNALAFSFSRLPSLRTLSQWSGEPCFKCHHALQTSPIMSP